jgi:transglutaminase-like putative cysteine protease
MDQSLASGPVIDAAHPSIVEMAHRLSSIEACFLFVRDEIEHCIDAQRGPVVLCASEALEAGVGYCYTKAHLLTALLRAAGHRAGLCYQRLTLDGPGTGFCLHGLSAVWLDGGWYRIDPRGNRPGVDAQYTPPVERLAFELVHAGEYDVPGVFAKPLLAVVDALSGRPAWDALLAALPDAPST